MQINLKKFNLLVLIATMLAIFCALFFKDAPGVQYLSALVAKITLNCLKMISIPLVFFSILSTLEHIHEQKNLGNILRPTLLYALISTTCAAVGALGFYLIFRPYRHLPLSIQNVNSSSIMRIPDISTLVNFLIPDNFFRPFIDGNIFSVLFLSIVIFLATLKMKSPYKKQIVEIYGTFFQLILKVVSIFIYVIPFGVWAFIYHFLSDLKSNLFDISPLLLYFMSIVCANLFQGLVVIPLLLKANKVQVLRTARELLPAFFFGFFSRSSAATLPITLDCTERTGVNPLVARFVLPLCTSINMNGCAAFIFTTLCFVLEINGVHHSLWSYLFLLALSVLAASANSAVPMGCYMMATSLLSTANVQMNILGLILPIYTLIDMLETPINIWSDVAIASIVDRKKPQLLD